MKAEYVKGSEIERLAKELQQQNIRQYGDSYNWGTIASAVDSYVLRSDHEGAFYRCCPNLN